MADRPRNDCAARAVGASAMWWTRKRAHELVLSQTAGNVECAVTAAPAELFVRCGLDSGQQAGQRRDEQRSKTDECRMAAPPRWPPDASETAAQHEFVPQAGEGLDALIR